MFDYSAPVPSLAELSPCHFVGVGGVGMSGIAKIMVARGVTVSGSDAKDVPVLAVLTAQGATVGVGFEASRLTGVRSVCVGSAIKPDNAEVLAAQAAGLPIFHRSQGLQAVMAGQRGVAVAGTNGKTTTSSFITMALRHNEIDPSFAIGGELIGAGTNAHHGVDDVFVAEACESDGSFVVYRPVVSVITNVQPDHLDYYGTFDAVLDSFGRFAACLPDNGLLVACADDEGAAQVAQRQRSAGGRVRTYGTESGADVRLVDVQHGSGGVEFVLQDPAAADPVSSVSLQVPGVHNALNAVAAYCVLVELGLSPARARAGISAFTGTRRRFEAKGEVGGVRVFDDYAHNPAKVAAAVQTARAVAGAGRVIAIFQPHLYSRTVDFAREFAESLCAADIVIVMDVYAAREEPVPGVDGATITQHIAPSHGQVFHEPTFTEAVTRACGAATEGDVILTIGAGDVTALGPQLLSCLAGHGGGGDGSA